MKYLFNKLGRACWWIAGPVRRPLVRRFDRHLVWLLGSVSLGAEIPHDLDLTLDSVVRELGRLQVQVEILQQQLDELQSHDAGRPRKEKNLAAVNEIA
jgi:hypothetical protein